jgi:hypothetical protein
MRGEGKGEPELGGEARAEIARAQQIERHVQPGARDCLDRLAWFGGKKVRLQLEHILRESVPAAAEETAQGAGCQLIAPRRAAQSKIDPAGKERLERSELLGDDKGRVVRQHDAARADTNAFGFARHVADDNRRRCARDAGKIMMFGQPEAMVAPLLGVLGEIDGVPERQRRIASLDDGREIEHGKARHGRV